MARCIDGSPGVYLHYAASPDSPHKDDWVIYFQGGGACTSNEQCLHRSKTPLGSSTFVPATAPPDQSSGILSMNCTKNPDFCQYNMIMVFYCDGYIYSGSRTEPESHNGTELYYRGAYIRRAVAASLVGGIGANAPATFANARNVLVTGCSAGALNLFFHAETFAASLKRAVPTIARLKVVPLSGFFLSQPNYEWKLHFRDQFEAWDPTTNASVGFSAACTARLPPSLKWMCSSAEANYANFTFPMFVVNSQTDAWQIPCILLSTKGTTYPNSINCLGAPGYAEARCGTKMWAANTGPGRHLFRNCTPEQMTPIFAYEQAFANRVVDVPGFRANGNGAFISSCYTHCEGLIDRDWVHTTVEGLSMQKAVSKWWHADVSEPAQAHTYIDCRRPHVSPYECNPSCTNPPIGPPSDKEEHLEGAEGVDAESMVQGKLFGLTWRKEWPSMF